MCIQDLKKKKKFLLSFLFHIISEKFIIIVGVSS